MLHYTPPQLVEMSSSTLSPFTKPKRFSTSTQAQDKHQHSTPQTPELDGATTSSKRTSKLGEFMARARTASLPPRPHTSSGPSPSKHRLGLGTIKGKAKEKRGLLSPDGDGDGVADYVYTAASSSMTSGEYRFLRSAVRSDYRACAR
jgi:hypothetical protein